MHAWRGVAFEEVCWQHSREIKRSLQTIHLTMITTYGVAYGKHSGIVQKEVHMDDLFAR